MDPDLVTIEPAQEYPFKQRKKSNSIFNICYESMSYATIRQTEGRTSRKYKEQVQLVTLVYTAHTWTDTRARAACTRSHARTH
ncbi:hypothetical protein EVAR_95882_1 [Eumeta japonica]|uniref:Uncharacterized protein n=1 Tax=Eumeta variegata TaxID=151549 RepID=A0A4C1VLN0_EUMVA|nr:hypothetical protein EVAR_95882_1 [Eumeta japonica]